MAFKQSQIEQSLCAWLTLIHQQGWVQKTKLSTNICIIVAFNTKWLEVLPNRTTLNPNTTMSELGSSQFFLIRKQVKFLSTSLNNTLRKALLTSAHIRYFLMRIRSWTLRIFGVSVGPFNMQSFKEILPLVLKKALKLYGMV